MRQLVSRMMCCVALFLLPSAVFAATSLVTVSYSNGVDVGTATDVIITLTNTNTLYPLKINSINNFTANASLNASITTNGCKNATLSVGGSCTFVIHFNSPTTQGVGAFSFSLSANNRIYPQVYSEPIAVFQEYTLTRAANPRSIVVDNGGTVWFTEYGTGKIGIITNGALSECDAITGGQRSSGLTGIALDPVNSLIWFTEIFAAGINVSDFASISATSFAANANCTGYTRYTPTLTPVGAGSFINLAIVPGTPETVWLANFNDVTPAGMSTAGLTSIFYDSTGTPRTLGAQYYYNNPPSYNTYVNPWALVVGHDTQHIWFTDQGNDSIGKLQIASPNSIVEYPINTSVQPKDPQYIVLGSNNHLWFTSWYNNAVVQVTTTGTITKYSVPTANSKPTGIAADTTGDIWFAEMATAADKIATFNLNSCTATACAMTEYDIPTSMVNPYAIAIDPNNSAHIWFTESNDPSSGGPGATISKIGELITTPLP